LFHTIEIISILLVALAMAPALAHLLEFPGKKRLTKEAYLTVQPIYYPGFTIAGGLVGNGELEKLRSKRPLVYSEPHQGSVYALVQSFVARGTGVH
jgi:hypothetical protein